MSCTARVLGLTHSLWQQCSSSQYRLCCADVVNKALPAIHSRCYLIGTSNGMVSYGDVTQHFLEVLRDKLIRLSRLPDCQTDYVRRTSGRNVIFSIFLRWPELLYELSCKNQIVVFDSPTDAIPQFLQKLSPSLICSSVRKQPSFCDATNDFSEK